MFIVMKSIEREMFLVGIAESEEEAKILMQKDFAGTFEIEFNGLQPTKENLEEYAEDADLNMEDGTAYITWNQNYDWAIIEVPSPYFAQKRWCREDIAGCLKGRGYQGLDWEVNKVLQEKGLKHLEDCLDEEWETIDQAMDDAGLEETCEPGERNEKYIQIAEDFMGKFNPDLWNGTGRMPLSVDDNHYESYCGADLSIDMEDKVYIQFDHDDVDGWYITCSVYNEDAGMTMNIQSCMKTNSIYELAVTIKELIENTYGKSDKEKNDENN